MTERQQCEKIYKAAFGTAQGFDELLFDYYFDDVDVLVSHGSVVSMLFKIPCEIELGEIKKTAYYLYAVATDEQYRGRGYMSELIKRCCDDSDALYFLKPATTRLEKFYERLGFSVLSATPVCSTNAKIIVGEKHKELSCMCKKVEDDYNLMFLGTIPPNIKKVYFKDTLE